MITRYASIPILLVLLSPPARAEEQSSSRIKEVEQAIVKRVNMFRQEHDLPKLKPSESLNAAAKKFAKFMAKNDKYGHQADGRTPAKRAKAAGYAYCVVRENIAYRTNDGDVTAKSLIDIFVGGWIDSPPHRENMLADSITQTGVAVATADEVTFYAVQMFGRPKSAAIHLTVYNRSGEIQPLKVESRGGVDEIDLPAEASLRLRRCFPTELTLSKSDNMIRLDTTGQLAIQQEGWEKLKQEDHR